MSKKSQSKIEPNQSQSEVKTFALFIGITLLLILSLIGAGFWISTKNSDSQSTNSISDLKTENGKQILELTAKGGYKPNFITAKADTESTLKISTNNTYDCSSEVVIRSLNYDKTLNPNGITEVNIPPQKAGTVINGMCGMGMYQFKIKFS